MKYFVGTALGKNTSSVLGNAFETIWGDFFHSCGECYASAWMFVMWFHSSVWKEFHSCVMLQLDISPLFDPILGLWVSFEAVMFIQTPTEAYECLQLPSAWIMWWWTLQLTENDRRLRVGDFHCSWTVFIQNELHQANVGQSVCTKESQICKSSPVHLLLDENYLICWASNAFAASKHVRVQIA